MISTINFKNYKIFKEKQSLELKPITILIGKNNSGKSAVAKLPTVIEGSLNSNTHEAIQLVNDGVEIGGELRDLIYGKANRTLDIGIEYSNEYGENKLNVAVLITEEKKKQTSKIDFWQLNDEARLHYQGTKNIYQDDISGHDFKCEFLGFELANYFYSDKQDSSGTTLRQTAKLKTDYIGPIRTIPERDYRLISQKLEKFGINGENSYQFLIEDALTTDKKILSQVSKWYQNNFEGWGIKINQDRAPVFQVEIQRNEIRQNIKDAGMGINQVLPLVVRAFKPCREDTLIIIEEPETHLHPAAHGNLAELFVKSIDQRNKRYLIETHSQNFVLRLRRLIAEGKLSKEKLAIYYVCFDQDKNYSNLEKIEVDDLGQVTKWPEGVFTEALDETIAIRTAQLANTTHAD